VSVQATHFGEQLDNAEGRGRRSSVILFPQVTSPQRNALRIVDRDRRFDTARYVLVAQFRQMKAPPEQIWSAHLPFGPVIGSALTCAMLAAGFMGSVIPMVSKRLGFDPAATAGPFETAFQDVVGFAVFLWLASLLVDYLK
jgi:hypothetical protein